MKKNITYLLFAIMFFTVSSASAHTMWLNLDKSTAHPPGHVLSSIGWGHSIPLDDFPEGLNFDSYFLVDPDQKKTELPLPDTKKDAGTDISGITLINGDLGIHKFKFSDTSKEGTYQVALSTKGNYYTSYLDKKGHKKWAFNTSMDKVKNAKKLLDGLRHQAFAKSYFNVGQWSDPKALGFDLEIMPKADLSNVRVGDLVEFDVSFMGKPLNSSPEISIEYLTAKSNSFGDPDGFMLSCIIFNGKAKFRMPAAGQWVLNVYTRQNVTPDNDLKHLADKCTTVLYSSTLSFSVKP